MIELLDILKAFPNVQWTFQLDKGCGLQSLSKSARVVSPKSGSWPHFGVNIRFFDGGVWIIHIGLEAYMSGKGSEIMGWCRMTSPTYGLNATGPVRAIGLLSDLH